MDRLLVPLKSLIPWSLALGGALVAYHGLMGQVALQASLAGAMSSVATSVHEVGALTAQTAAALGPLGTVTTNLKGMNSDLETIVADLRVVNTSLTSLNQGQGALATTVGQLNQNLSAVGQGLASVDKQNRSLLARTEGMAVATGDQARAVDALSSLTLQSVDSLRTINRRLKFLQRF